MMENFLVGLAMLAPAIFVVLLIAGGIVIVSAWIYALLPDVLKGPKPASPASKQRIERRSGRDRRRGVPSDTRSGYTAVS